MRFFFRDDRAEYEMFGTRKARVWCHIWIIMLFWITERSKLAQNDRKVKKRLRIFLIFCTSILGKSLQSAGLKNKARYLHFRHVKSTCICILFIVK